MTTLIVEVESSPTTGKTMLGLCIALGAAAQKVRVAYVLPSERHARFYATEYLRFASRGVYILSAEKSTMNFPPDATIAVLDGEDQFPVSAEGPVRDRILRRLQLHRCAQLISLRNGPVQTAGES